MSRKITRRQLRRLIESTIRKSLLREADYQEEGQVYGPDASNADAILVASPQGKGRASQVMNNLAKSLKVQPRKVAKGYWVLKDFEGFFGDQAKQQVGAHKAGDPYTYEIQPGDKKMKVISGPHPIPIGQVINIPAGYWDDADKNDKKVLDYLEDAWEDIKAAGKASSAASADSSAGDFDAASANVKKAGKASSAGIANVGKAIKKGLGI